MNQEQLSHLRLAVIRELAGMHAAVALDHWVLDDGASPAPVVTVYGVLDAGRLAAHRRVMDLFGRMFGENGPWPLLFIHTVSDCTVGRGMSR